jgi:hypothetical protein
MAAEIAQRMRHLQQVFYFIQKSFVYLLFE